MVLPEQPVTLTPAEIAEFNEQLTVARHNINNYLALIVAATELMRRKPEMATDMLGRIAEQPERISKELLAFGREFDRRLGITR